MARMGSFMATADVYGTPLSLIHPPDNQFEVVANTTSDNPPDAQATIDALQKKAIEDEIAALYNQLTTAQDLNK